MNHGSRQPREQSKGAKKPRRMTVSVLIVQIMLFVLLVTIQTNGVPEAIGLDPEMAVGWTIAILLFCVALVLFGWLLFIIIP